ncbi:OadG family protein [bacterium]|nr:OadG family protein [bacterium]MBU1994093.1 OadG family protein [bacterium]
MDTNLVIEGFKFMALGMGTVFLFLIILIVMMNIMSAVIHRLFPEPKPSASAQSDSQNNNKRIVAAITAAIAHHRRS